MINSWYNKFYIALMGALVAAAPLVADGKVSLGDVVAIAIGLLTAIGVRQVANAAPPADSPPIRP